MKQYLINLRTAIKNGIIRIFPLPKMVFVFVFVIVSALLISCGSTKMVTQTVRDIQRDTIYLSNVQYDSIYIYQDHVSEHHLGALPPIDSSGKYLNTPMRTDTLYIKDKSIEYRYKLLKDTIRVVERDSIPYQVTVIETKEIQRPLTWFDHLTRWSFFFLIGALLTFLFIKIKRVL